MKEALFIGGTGTISMAITRLLASGNEWHLTLLNRGTRMGELPRGVDAITVDINDEATTAAVLEGKHFDTVCDFIGFVPAQVERDFRLFNGKADQFMYISSASAYNKLPADCVITEGTTLANPYWEYSRNKIACEEFLLKKYREEGFPVTIIRPSHTYDDRSVPLGVHGAKGSYQVIKRMLDGKPVIIHGDGTSLWTMTYNEDFAKGFVGLMANPHAIGEAFQITNDEHLTWNQIYQTIAKVLGVELKPYYVSSKFLADVGRQYDFTGSLIGDKANTVIFDNSKLKRAVPDFNPSIRFEEGIRRCLDNVLLNPALQIEDPDFDRWCDKVIAGLETAKRNITNQP
ncbi:MAG: NAD-dependent epimerase/dehydratase family protein [Lachnospiraceae bacterium]|nr:NAD-dependent epimerase/dehydratase family protein [Lachnospiraceae bacterium]